MQAELLGEQCQQLLTGRDVAYLPNNDDENEPMKPSMSAHQYKVGHPPRPDGPTENVTFRLSKQEHRALRAHAARDTVRSKSELIRHALERAGLLIPPDDESAP